MIDTALVIPVYRWTRTDIKKQGGLGLGIATDRITLAFENRRFVLPNMKPSMTVVDDFALRV